MGGPVDGCVDLGGEVTVVGQKKKTLGLDVEAADRLHGAREARREEVEHRVARLRVVYGRHVPARLVQEHVRLRPPGDRDALPVHPDGVALPIRAVSQLGDLAVDANPALTDPLLRLAARREAGLGDDLLNPDGSHGYDSSSSSSS